MKKIVSFVVCALLATASFAQGQFGIIGGLTSSQSKISTAFSDIKAGTANQYHVGITYYQPLALGFAIQPGIEYNVKGASFEEINFKTGFVEVPVQVQWGVNLFSIIRPFVMAEPFIGYAVSNNVSSAGVTLSGWDSVKNRFECGIGLGGGIQLFKHFQLTVRYFWNLGTLYTANLGSIKTTLAETKCSGVKFSAAILF
ncbi:MAG: PorT family protein [Bacteroidales bacterium]|nr:PorT family protein [Bacteroidales bacterium]